MILVPGLALIAALDRNRAIGRGNALPWHLPDDLKRFKALTLGKPVLMGRKTAESLGRALPGRRNLVLTRSGRAPFAGMEPVASLEQALAAVERIEPSAPVAAAAELMVIGGAEVYALVLPWAERLYLTHVDTEVENADVFFPDFDPGDWSITARNRHPSDDRHGHAFAFVDYRRIDPERAGRSLEGRA